MKEVLSFDGFREIDEGLSLLPKVTSKAVVRRALIKELKPVADMANGLWPGADDSAFAVSTKLKRGQQQPDWLPTAVHVHVGSTSSAPHAHLIEWGTEPRFHESGKYVGAVAPMPVFTPSWEAYRNQILQGLAKTLGEELAATMARRAKRGK